MKQPDQLLHVLYIEIIFHSIFKSVTIKMRGVNVIKNFLKVLLFLSILFIFSITMSGATDSDTTNDEDFEVSTTKDDYSWQIISEMTAEERAEYLENRNIKQSQIDANESD